MSVRNLFNIHSHAIKPQMGQQGLQLQSCFLHHTFCPAHVHKAMDADQSDLVKKVAHLAIAKLKVPRLPNSLKQSSQTIC